MQSVKTAEHNIKLFSPPAVAPTFQLSNRREIPSRERQIHVGYKITYFSFILMLLSILR